MTNDDNVSAFGRGSVTFTYVADWDMWQSAVMAFDDFDDGAPLLLLLLSDEIITATALALLVDLLDRRKLKPEAELPADTLQVLTKGLRAGQPQVRELLRLIFHHGLLMKKPGRPKAPLWQRSEAEAQILCAKLEVRAARREKREKLTDKERELIADLHGVSLGALDLALKGKPTGGIRRIKRRHLKNK
jgi:hypothetical protein